MADENTDTNGVNADHAAGFSTGSASSSSPLDDVRIIDEVVIAPPKPKAANTSPIEVPNTSPLPPRPTPPVMQKFSATPRVVPPPTPVIPTPLSRVAPALSPAMPPPTVTRGPATILPEAPQSKTPAPPPSPPIPKPGIPQPPQKPPIPPPIPPLNATPPPVLPSIEKKPEASPPQKTSSPPTVPPAPITPPPASRLEDLPGLARDIVEKTPAERARAEMNPAPEAKESIQKMLGDIKLPERREDTDDQKKRPQTVYDTSLATLPDKKIGQLEETRGPGKVPSELITYKNAERAESAPPQAPSSQRAAQSAESSSVVLPLRTLKNDFQDIVREKKISLVRAAALEQDKKREDRFTALGVTETRRRHTFNIIFISLLLALLGTAAFFGAALIIRERSGSAVNAPTSSILFSEISVPFSVSTLSPFDVKNILVQARRGNNASLGTISRIVPMREVPIAGSTEGAVEEVPLSFAEFLAALGVVPPPDLLRALSDDFFLGLHTVDENAPLIVIPVESYERAFAGMLEWERTMNADLAPVFTSVPGTTVGPDGLLTRRAFEDVVMRNYDVRALKDDNGEIQLYYSFPTRNLLIIAENAYSFAEILSRLRAERKL